jgi:protein transport protein SEC24
LKDWIYPRLYSLHDMPDSVAVRDDNNRLPMPVLKHLTAENIEHGGVYLVKTGLEMVLWVGRGASVDICRDLFGVTTYEQIPDGLVSGAPWWWCCS